MTKHDNVSQGKIMKATEFVKKFGIERTKDAVNNAPCGDLQVYCQGDITIYFYFVCSSLHGESAVYSTKNKEWIGFHDWFCRNEKLAQKANQEMIPVEELKRLVESHELLGLFKSLDQAKADVAACEYAGHADLLVKLDCGIGYINTARVKQAIADVEACQ